MAPPTVALVDVGSNSIKLLVAARGRDQEVESLTSAVEEVRIGGGIAETPPRLPQESMDRALAAIQSLLKRAAPYQPVRTLIVGTSAVRDAVNRQAFAECVQKATGHSLRILSGPEEAAGVARGLAADPALSCLEHFYLFDLGGGSLECVAFRSRQVEQSVSLPLGCVRLTRLFVSDSSQPLSQAEGRRLAQHVREALIASGFVFSLPPQSPAVATGGSAATARALLASRSGPAEEPAISRPGLESLFHQLASLSLAERRAVPHLPPARADVFPAALAALLEILRWGDLPGYLHSTYNLRYGLAAEELAQLG